MAAKDTFRPLLAAAESRTAFLNSGDDSGLLHDAEQGDAAAFEQIASRYDRALLSLFLALTGSEAVALDLCHSTLLTAYRQLQRRGLPSLYIGFYRLAAQHWLAWAAVHSRDLREEPLPADSNLRHALCALSTRERLVFTLKANQRLALETVAQILDLPHDTVARTFTRAVARLRLPRQHRS